MSSMFAPPRFVAAALCLGLLSAAAGARAGTVNHGSFDGNKVNYHDVTESGPNIPPALFVPKTPTVTTSPNDQLNFLPEQFVQTDQSILFDLKQKSSLLHVGVQGRPLVGDPSLLGYALSGATLNIAGTYILNAPFAAGDFSPIYDGASRAKVSMSATLTAQVTGVNFSSYSGGTTLLASIPITADNVTDLTGPGYVSGNWSGMLELDWNALRAASGVGPSDAITDIALQINATIGAASIYGRSEVVVTNFNINNPTVPVAVPVPEPPTIILASLGAVAVVATGYRRKLKRRRGVEETNGAIALTA